MKCDKCSNPASVFLTQVINGEMKKSMLCHSCAEEQGLTDPTGFALADFLGGPQADDPEESSSSEALDLLPEQASLDECPNCGFTLERLRKVGRLGCSQCYDSFRADISPMLRNMHGASSHQGKIPAYVASQSDQEALLSKLKDQLDIAITCEDFEQAAVLRDQIRSVGGSEPGMEAAP